MRCARCGNTLAPNTRGCPKCGYILTNDEFDDEVEFDRKILEEKKKAKSHVISIPKIKKDKPPISKEKARQITLIKEEKNDKTKYVSNFRFLGYSLLLIAIFSFLTGMWYITKYQTTNSMILSITFVIVSFAFVGIGIYIIKVSGVTKAFLSKKSTVISIASLIVALLAFILLLIEMGNNNMFLMFIAIGLFLVGLMLFLVSVFSKEKNSRYKR